MPSAQAEGRGVVKFKFSLGYTVSSGQSKPQSETVSNKNNCAVPWACNPSTEEADAGGRQAISRPRLHNEVPDRDPASKTVSLPITLAMLTYLILFPKPACPTYDTAGTEQTLNKCYLNERIPLEGPS